ncbi:MAG: thiol reductant ABC exporter subunit CydC [Chloroflexi bacterium]|nr:thiol reductant ABC exporter subunit CydC [Chloroflexota bacterium]
MYFDPRLFALTQGVRLRIAFAAVLGLIAVGAGVSRLAVSGVIIYRVLTGQASFSALAMPLLTIAALIVVRSTFQYWQNSVSHHTANVVKIKLREEAYEHALKLGPGYADRNRTGDLVLTLVEGIERLEVFFGQYLSQIIVSAIAPIAIFAYMVTLDLYIALIFLGFALATLAVPAAFHRWNRNNSYRRRRSYGELGSDFLDSVQGLATLKSFGQSKQRGKELEQRIQNLYRSTMGVVAANQATSGTSILFMATGAAVALAVGAVRVSNGDMDLRPLLIVLMLGVEVFRPMRELVNLYHQGMATLSAAQSVFGILDEPVTILEPEAATETLVTEIEPDITFEDVTFGYDGGYRAALEDVSFELRKGETLGVVGASGAGKSTLVWLMYRFHDPQTGTIKIGGHDLRDLPLSTIRDNIAVVTQDTYLFHGTVADNLRFGKPDATPQELEDAARAANAHEFISRLPHGYETVVGERAARLSGGQRQRLAIARALLKDAPILLLDEALSSVDAENEAVIQDALDRLMENRTTLVIAHRLSSVINADRILVLDEGKVAEIGTHIELIAAGATYAGLMRQQTQTDQGKTLPFDTQGGIEGGLDAPSAPPAHPPPELPNLNTGHHHATTSRPPTDEQEINIRSWSVWMRLLGLVRPVKWQFLITVVLGMLNHGSVIILGALSALLVGAVFRDEPLNTLVILVCTLAPLSALLFYLESWQAHDMAFRLLARMRIDLYEKLEPLAPAYMVRRRSGDFVSVVGGDVETVEYFFAHAVSPMIVAILIPGGLLIALSVIAWPIAAVLAPFLVAVAVSPFFANSRIERLGDEIRGRIGDIHAYMVDSIQGMREITAFGRGADRTGELTQKGWDHAGHLVRFQKSQAFQIGFIEAMMGLGGLAVMAMGVWLVLEGQIERTHLPLVSVLALASFSPITELARTMKQMMETLAASRRILAIHDETVPVQDGPGIPTIPASAPVPAPVIPADAGTQQQSNQASRINDVRPSVEFEQVEFAYARGDPQALANVSLDIPSGGTVAIVGRSGAGKTTIAYLMMRFWDPDRGEIELSGNRINQFKLDDLRGRMALVAQDTYLFNNTIRENIRLGRQNATDQDVEEAASQANAADFIDSFPDGYDTEVGERGMQLSGGQRQRIAIARAILKNAPLLILDEATSHLDAISETAVRDALDRLMEGRTTVVIAHRLSTIRNADNILVLDEGKVVEQGTHDQLLSHRGLYAQLVNTQMA